VLFTPSLLLLSLVDHSGGQALGFIVHFSQFILSVFFLLTIGFHHRTLISSRFPSIIFQIIFFSFSLFLLAFSLVSLLNRLLFLLLTQFLHLILGDIHKVLIIAQRPRGLLTEVLVIFILFPCHIIVRLRVNDFNTGPTAASYLVTAKSLEVESPFSPIFGAFLGHVGIRPEVTGQNELPDDCRFLSYFVEQPPSISVLETVVDPILILGDVRMPRIEVLIDLPFQDPEIVGPFKALYKPAS